MTCNDKDNALAALLPLLGNGQEDRLREALELLVNAAMLLERQRHLRAEPFERTETRNGHANGFKDKGFQTRLGEMHLRVPQVRDSTEPFYPQSLQSLEKGLRSERALKLALAEMYVQGVSTRKVAAITERLCGFAVTSTQVSRAAAELDAHLSAWRERPLSQTPYLILDARYEKVRQGGIVQSAAVLIAVAVGVGLEGRRQVLGVSVALSEQEAHWRAFLSVLEGFGGARPVRGSADRQ
jgi:transposase-like protein